ncbi:putative neuroblastoma breakpoint family member 5 [Octodon degus]|uniref:Neuroblastoma breakpoint family member 5 n=1 Tax=Octodon degus TaxID=10160 RepID=A0A6P6EIK9_OCTDE|nr:putative neuroblastoma breakpoint family member 5 [Octodon degus]
MAAPDTPLCDPRAEMSSLESNQESRSQQFEDLKENFLPSESVASSLAKLLQKYKCLNNHIPESLLREKQQCKAGEQADEVSLVEKLREARTLIQDQKRKLFLLRQKLRHGREVFFRLSDLLSDLLTLDDAECDQEQGLQDELIEACRLVERFFYKLSPDNCEHQLGEDDSAGSLSLSDNQSNPLTQEDTEELKGHEEQPANGCKPAERLLHDVLSGNNKDMKEEEIFYKTYSKVIDENRTLSQEDPEELKRQDHGEQPANGCKPAERLLHDLLSGNNKDMKEEEIFYKTYSKVIDENR